MREVMSYREEIIRRRKIVRRAFDLVRDDQRHMVSRGRFLLALGGKARGQTGGMIPDDTIGLAETITRIVEGAVSRPHTSRDLP